MNNKRMGIIATVSTVIMGAVVAFDYLSPGNFLYANAKTTPTEYKISLDNAENKLTFEEGGSWDNPKAENTPFIRQTSNGNNITFRHSGGRSLTSVDNNFCIARGSDGWIANETAITGITKIEIQCQAGLGIRFDFSYSNPLNNYTYHGGDIPDTVDYHTDTLVGSTVYTVIPNDEGYNFFRFQPIDGGNNWINYIKIYYSCVSVHTHDWVHYDGDPEYHEHNGTLEHDKCSICGKMRDNDRNTITSTVVEPVIYDLPCDGRAITLETPVPVTSTSILKFDFKIKDPSKRFIVKLLNDWDNYIGFHGGIEFSTSSSGQLFAGCNIEQMTDGWTRLTIDMSKLNMSYRVSGTVTEIKSIYVDNNTGATTGAYMEVNSKATNFFRGHHYEGQVNYTMELKSSEFISFDNLVINMDILWEGKLDPNKNNYIRVMFAENWDDFYGYYEIKPDTKDGDFDGITVSTCPDGYKRYTVFIDKCPLINGSNLPTTMKFIYVHNWSNQTGWIDYSWYAHSHDFEKTDAVSPFRENDGNIEYYTCQDPLCGKIVDKNSNEITMEDTVAPSKLQRYEMHGDSIQYQYDTPVQAGELITVDFKPDDPTQATCIALFETSSWDSYRGYYSFYGDGSYGGTQEEGITVSIMLDGYIRVTFDMTKLYKWNTTTAQQGLSQVKWVYLRGDWTHTGGYIEFDAKGGKVMRGQKFAGDSTDNTGFTIYFDHTLARTSIVNVDVYYTSNPGTKISMHIGDWTNYNGMFNLYEDETLMDQINGLKVTKLEDSYVRYSFTLSELTKVNNPGTVPNYEHVYVRGLWTNASGWIDVSYIENFDSPVVEDIY